MVLIVPGHYYFPGLDSENAENSDHTYQQNSTYKMNKSHINECIRISFSQSEEVISTGMRIIAEELNSL